MQIAFIRCPSSKRSLIRCCSSFAPYPFKHFSTTLTISTMPAALNPIVRFSRAASSSSATESDTSSLFCVPESNDADKASASPPPKPTAIPAPDRHTFASMNLHENIQRSIAQVFKFEYMTPVQHKVLSNMPTSSDMLVRAKTGTGKTLAFLAVAIDKLRLKGPTEYSAIEAGKRGASILVISPTRELAMQIAVEARKLTQFTPFSTVLLVGGESKNNQLRQMDRRCDIVIATPGRLNDILSTARHSSAKFKDTKVLILDEADRLLEMGFKEEIDKIISHIPKEHETLLFSATVNAQTRTIAAKTLKHDYLTLDCIPKDEQDSHLSIRQSYVMAPYSQQLPLLLDIIRKHKISQTNAKIIVFLPTANLVQYMSQVFSRLPQIEAMEIHSRLSQIQRVRASNQYRAAQSGVLFTSDVSARGVDYPGVTLVIQVGVPPSKDQYIHRVGRTGRAGKSGEGILLLTPFERDFLAEVRDLPIKQDLRFNGTLSSSNKDNVEDLKRVIMKAPTEDSIQCFSSWCGFIRGVFGKYKVSNDVLLRAAEEFAENILMLDRTTVKRIASKILMTGGGGGGNRRSSGSSSSNSRAPQREYGNNRDSRGGGYEATRSGGFGGNRSRESQSSSPAYGEARYERRENTSASSSAYGERPFERRDNFNSSSSFGDRQSGRRDSFNAAPTFGDRQSGRRDNFNSSPAFGERQSQRRESFGAREETRFNGRSARRSPFSK